MDGRMSLEQRLHCSRRPWLDCFRSQPHLTSALKFAPLKNGAAPAASLEIGAAARAATDEAALRFRSGQSPEAEINEL